MGDPHDPDPDPLDLHGRRGALCDALTHRLAHGPPLSKWDYCAVGLLGDVLDLKVGAGHG